MNENYWSEHWTKEKIKAMVLEQFQAFWRRDTGIHRQSLVQVQAAIGSTHAVIISGLRRAGKSTLLAQLAHHLGEANFYYLNCEDDRLLGFQAGDFDGVFQVLAELFGDRKIFLVDEIQSIPGWEHFVRRFMARGYKLLMTGSNASLLSRELGSRLTGRYLTIELFPFSFLEFLQFGEIEIPDLNRMTTVDSARLNHLLSEYLRLGGIPEPLKYPELPLLRYLYDDVLNRDIAARYHIEEVRALRELAFYLMSNPASLISFNKLKAHLQLGSVNTIRNYISYLEDSWLFFLTNVYDYSVKRQQIAPKKIYAIDPGMINAVGFSFSRNAGKLLENLVYLALRQKYQEIYYLQHPNKYDVDFFLPQHGQLFQVSQDMNNPATREREIRSLKEAMNTFNLPTGTILTMADGPSVRINKRVIEIRSTARWLLE